MKQHNTKSRKYYNIRLARQRMLGLCFIILAVVIIPRITTNPDNGAIVPLLIGTAMLFSKGE